MKTEKEESRQKAKQVCILHACGASPFTCCTPCLLWLLRSHECPSLHAFVCMLVCAAVYISPWAVTATNRAELHLFAAGREQASWC